MAENIRFRNIAYASYCLVLVGYMTLTISLPLVGQQDLGTMATPAQFKYGLSLLFLLFSISAITLGRIADMVGSYRVLNYAQPISIVGLIIIALAPNFWVMDIGFILMGIGTGCYSSIARLLITKYATNQDGIRKAFVWFSIIVAASPLISSCLMLSLSTYSWRIGYGVMAIIEILVLILVSFSLKILSKKAVRLTIKEIFSGYWYCLKRFNYLINMIAVGSGFTLFISIFIGLSHTLFVTQYNMSSGHFSIVTVVTTLFYIVGILIFRLLLKITSVNLIRTAGVIVFIGAAVWFWFTSSEMNILFAIYLASLILGIIMPMSSSSGMIAIKTSQGAAAALYTFAFAIISAVWTVLLNHLDISMKHFFTAAITTTAVIFLVISILEFIFIKKKKYGNS